jgi:hypothetical protein
LEKHGRDEEAREQREWSPIKERAVAFLEGFAAQCELTYDRLLEKLENAHKGTDDSPRMWSRMHIGIDTPDYNPEEVWENYELATGIKISGDFDRYERFIYCSC